MDKTLEAKIQGWFEGVIKGYYTVQENVTVGTKQVKYVFCNVIGGQIAGGVSIDTYNQDVDKIEALKVAARAKQVEPGAREARRAVYDLFSDARGQEDYPGTYYPMIERAQKALSDWRVQYPLAAKQEAEERAKQEVEENQRRQKQYESSFVARGLD